MFGIVLTSTVTLMHVYVFWRAGTVPLLEPYVFNTYEAYDIWSVKL